MVGRYFAVLSQIEVGAWYGAVAVCKYHSFLESLAISLDENSASGTLGKSDRAMALGDGVKVAPVICYESIYGDYVSDYVGDGAQWLAVVTNDAWWRNTAGHKQHFSYAKLRAIEQRKWVARAANTGISGFINPLGESVMESVWYQGRAGRCNVPLEDIESKDGGFVVGAGTQMAMVQRIVPNEKNCISAVGRCGCSGNFVAWFVDFGVART